MSPLKAALLGTALSIATMALSAGGAEAGIMLKYSLNGGAFVTVTDGGAGDVDAGAGSVSINLAGLGSFAATGPSTMSNGNNNGITTGGNYQLHLTLAGNVARDKAGSIDLYITSTDFEAFEGSNYSFKSDLGISANPGTLHYQSFLDLENDPFGEGILLADITRTTAGSAAGYSAEVQDPVTGPFSITERFQWSWLKGAQRGIAAVGTVDFLDIPEPETLALMGFSLLGLGWATRRRKKS